MWWVNTIFGLGFSKATCEMRKMCVHRYFTTMSLKILSSKRKYELKYGTIFDFDHMINVIYVGCLEFCWRQIFCFRHYIITHSYILWLGEQNNCFHNPLFQDIRHPVAKLYLSRKCQNLLRTNRSFIDALYFLIQDS